MDNILAKIDRRRLDFDFEKICSVTLSQNNVFVCLTCGRYYQGRTSNTPAHLHSLEEEHPLYMHLESGKVFILPDNIEFDDPSLGDIRYVMEPTFTPENSIQLDQMAFENIDLHGRQYVAGFIGFNNIKCNDYANVVIQTILHIKPIRDLFLTHSFPNSKLLKAVGEVCRKMWNPKPFKALISPHEFMQAVNVASDRRYSVNKQADVLEFMTWMLHTLNRELIAQGSSIITSTLQGNVKISSKFLNPHNIAASLADNTLESKRIPFYFLSLDLPPTPLYQSTSGEYVIPQVPLIELMEKYNGGKFTQNGDCLQAFDLDHLPPYIILHFKRFHKAHLILEKNRTVVTHPLHGLKISDSKGEEYTYDLVSNICHIGEPELGKGRFLVQLLHPATGKWYEIQELNVKEIPPLNVPLSESYIQVWKCEMHK